MVRNPRDFIQDQMNNVPLGKCELPGLKSLLYSILAHRWDVSIKE